MRVASPKGVHLVALFTLFACLVVLPGTVRAQERSMTRALEPIGAIVEAFRTYPLVALGEGEHGNEQSAAFRLSLVRDPRFAAVVNDIVVEFGNAKYQDVVDRFIAGADIPRDELRHVWQDTTQPHDVWDRPIYEDFLNAVRAVNRSLAPDRRLRVLLGDPPIEWSTFQTSADLRQWIDAPGRSDRNAFPAAVIEREVIAKRRKALIIYGDLHFERRTSALNFEDSPRPTLIALLEKKGVRALTIWVGEAVDLSKIDPVVRSWNEPRFVMLRDSTLGAADFTFYFPGEQPRVALQNNQAVPIPRAQWKRRAMADHFDALLYLGHPLTITIARPPQDLCADASFIEMRTRRTLMAGQLNWASTFRMRCALPAPVLPELWRTYQARGIVAALASLPADPSAFPGRPYVLNRFAQVLLEEGKTSDAIAAGRRNAELFPAAANTYVSLGAAYAAERDRTNAILNYKRALELDPSIRAAAEALVQLTAP